MQSTTLFCIIIMKLRAYRNATVELLQALPTKRVWELLCPILLRCFQRTMIPSNCSSSASCRKLLAPGNFLPRNIPVARHVRFSTVPDSSRVPNRVSRVLLETRSETQAVCLGSQQNLRAGCDRSARQACKEWVRVRRRRFVAGWFLLLPWGRRRRGWGAQPPGNPHRRQWRWPESSHAADRLSGGLRR